MLCRLEQHRALPIESRELFRVDLGHLEQGDAKTDDEEAENHCDKRDGGGFQALVEDEAAEALGNLEEKQE